MSNLQHFRSRSLAYFIKKYAAVKITEKPRHHHHKDFMASVYTPVQNFQYHRN